MGSKRPCLAAAAALLAGGCVVPGTRVAVRPVEPAVPLAAADPAARADLLYHKAVAALSARDYGGALDFLQQARQYRADDPRVFNALGVVYDKLGRFDLSARYYAQAQGLDPGSEIVRSNLRYSQLLQHSRAGEAAEAPLLVASVPSAPRQAPETQTVAVSGLRRVAREPTALAPPQLEVRDLKTLAALPLESHAPELQISAGPTPVAAAAPVAIADEASPTQPVVAATDAPGRRRLTFVSPEPVGPVAALAAETSPAQPAAAAAATPELQRLVFVPPELAAPAEPVAAPADEVSPAQPVAAAAMPKLQRQVLVPPAPAEPVAAPAAEVSPSQPLAAAAATPTLERLVFVPPAPVGSVAAPAAEASPAQPVAPEFRRARAEPVVLAPTSAEVRELKTLAVLSLEPVGREPQMGLELAPVAPDAGPARSPQAALIPLVAAGAADRGRSPSLTRAGAPVPARVVALAPPPGLIRIAAAPKSGPLIVVAGLGREAAARKVKSRLIAVGWSVRSRAGTPARRYSVIRYASVHAPIALGLARTLPFPVRLAECGSRCAGVTLTLGVEADRWWSHRRRFKV
jgi:hypothetical protein